MSVSAMSNSPPAYTPLTPLDTNPEQIEVPGTPGPNGSDSDLSYFDNVDQDSSDGDIPYGLKSLFVYVEYAVSLFQEKVGRVPLLPGAGVTAGARIPIDLRAEVEMLANTVLRTWKNCGTLRSLPLFLGETNGLTVVNKVVVTFWVLAEAALFGLFQFREVPPKIIGSACFLAKCFVGVIRTKRK
ncbi:hypothetical protein FA13DRAFT_1713163 [Coprinellus micaceus]|uniref:Uncharacterized protein n=1 Tax=Coprinellus micaceus TaxID=71717 RepID=A0A4Y7SXK4_COPMI|nr:hypothetical protein FA13DRAFT_1713163 [Coprinellus micaceus]